MISSIRLCFLLKLLLYRRDQAIAKEHVGIKVSIHIFEKQIPLHICIFCLYIFFLGVTKQNTFLSPLFTLRIERYEQAIM